MQNSLKTDGHFSPEECFQSINSISLAVIVRGEQGYKCFIGLFVCLLFIYFFV